MIFLFCRYLMHFFLWAYRSHWICLQVCQSARPTKAFDWYWSRKGVTFVSYSFIFIFSSRFVVVLLLLLSHSSRLALMQLGCVVFLFFLTSYELSSTDVCYLYHHIFLGWYDLFITAIFLCALHDIVLGFCVLSPTPGEEGFKGC